MTQEAAEREAQILAQRCKEVHAGAGEAIAWVAEASKTAKRLRDEAPSLTARLRRVRNQARHLGSAATRPMTVGLFGLSQAGKSYLIAALVADDNGRLETILDGKPLDFLQHVNPTGGGSEATGLVTRFTRRCPQAPPGFPIQLSLLCEAEFIKVLGNSFFNDFDPEKVSRPTYGDHVRHMLHELERLRHDKPVPGMSADDVMDLYDYFEDRYHSSMQPFKADYWPSAVALAPYLGPKERARLFAILWGELPELTRTYLMLRSALEKLSFAEVVYAPLQALVEGAGEDLSTANSIMSVSMLNRLGLPGDDTLEVCPWLGNAPGEVVSLGRAALTALTAEIAFPLVKSPKVEVFNTLDVLDFPGYRGRLRLTSTNLGEVQAQLERQDRAERIETVNPVAQLVLRGKVAYLFERYTDNQEMNILIFCTPSDYQSEVVDVGPVLDRWISKTQGATPEQRAHRPSGLVWAITKFDKTITDALSQNINQLRLRWGEQGLMNRTLLERFGKYPWIREWHPGQPFNCVFLVRKPNIAGSFFNPVDGSEQGPDERYLPQLELVRQTFIEDETVKRFIATPPEAWDAMMRCNDGGISRLGHYLERVSDVGIKLERIAEQLDETVATICNELGRYYQKGSEEGVEQKKAIAAQVIKELGRRPSLMGELLFALEPRADDLRARYLRAESDASMQDGGAASTPEESTQEGAEQGGGTNIHAAPDELIDLGLDDLGLITADLPGDSAPGSADKQTKPSSTEVRYASAVMQEWVGQLREIPDHAGLLQYLGYTKKVIEDLVDELIAGAERHRLQDHLVEVTRSAERYASARRASLVERQVIAVRTVINDYIAWLGNERIPLEERATSISVKGHKLFAPPPPIPEGTLPQLTEQYLPYTQTYLRDWLEALKSLIIGNAGHGATREITVEQNMALGIILATISGAHTGSRSTAALMPDGQS